MKKYIVFDGDVVIWETSIIDIESYEKAIDILLLMDFKKSFDSMEIPDDLLYVDFLIDFQEPQTICSLYEYNQCDKQYKKIHDEDSLKGSTNKLIQEKIKKIDNFTHYKYVDFLNEIESIAQKINTQENIKTLYQMSSQNNFYSKSAQSIINIIQNKELDKNSIINYYGSVEKAADALASTINSL